MVERHFAWFNVETGAWIGDWMGRVSAPVVAPSLIGDARRMFLHEWQQQATRYVTPSGSHDPDAQACWNLDAWDDCPDGGAVCLDVTMYRWPVGDFAWAVFDGVDRLLDFREMRTYLEVTRARATLDASVRSPRLVRSTPQKLVIDVTGTILEPFSDRLFGRLVRRDGRLVFEPFEPGTLPEAVVLAITDRNEDLAQIRQLDPAAIPLQEA